MNAEPKVSLLVRNLNEENNLKILFNRLNSQNYKNFEVVFLDSGSTDNSVKFVESFIANFKIIIKHIDKEEFTFGRALNKCIEYAKDPKYVISLSAHCFPTSNDFIKNYVDIFEKNNSKIVFGAQLGYKDSMISEACHLNTWFSNDYGETSENPFSNNGNCGYEYSIFSDFKFDEALTGCEDIDLARKILDSGYSIFYGDKIAVEHFHQESYKTVYLRYLREAVALNSIFPYSFKFRHLLIGTIRETIRDIKFRKKTNAYQNRSLIDILRYRFAKNVGHYKGFGLNKNIDSNIYYYPKIKNEKFTKNLYERYLA